MREDAALSEITTQAAAAVGGLATGVTFERPNETDVNLGKYHCRLEFTLDDWTHAESGDGKTTRGFGVAFLQLLYPKNIGIGKPMSDGVILKELFEAKEINGIGWLIPSVQPVGRDGDHYLVNVRMPFEVEHNE